MVEKHQPQIPRRVSYSTTTVALLLGVCEHTAAKLIDNRIIQGFRLPTKRRDRRVSHEALCNYVCAHYELGIDLAAVFGPDWDQPVSAAELKARRPKRAARTTDGEADDQPHTIAMNHQQKSA